MVDSIWLIGLIILAQVPAPSAGSDVAAKLKETGRSIQAREAENVRALAVGLAAQGDSSAASQLRRLVPEARRNAVATRITPLAEVVTAESKGLASVGSGTAKTAQRQEGGEWRSELDRLRHKSASEYFALAKEAAAVNPPHLAVAGFALREVLARQPEHAEARRLLGYVPYEGGWARPFAVRQLKAAFFNHPVFGWVATDWVPHLDRGELPAPSVRGQKEVQWLPAQEADGLRSNWQNPWQIATEHFEIQTDVPLGEAIEFGRRLEAFYDLFFALMADVVGENLPLARRFRSPSSVADSTYRPHQISYFATKDEYVDHLRNSVDGIEKTLGYYNPPKPGRGNRATAYFFRDAGGQLPVTATLYHEVSHQLLFETAGPNAYTKNVGNYWVFEGLGTYFETVTPQTDGSLEVGGLVGERLAEAQNSLLSRRFTPLDQFVRLDQNGFNREERIHVNYQQAMALAVFLMQFEGTRYRDDFLDYVRDAYRGRIKSATGRSLEDRLNQPLKAIEGQFREFLSGPEIQPRG
jgi:hypothetical protein